MKILTKSPEKYFCTPKLKSEIWVIYKLQLTTDNVLFKFHMEEISSYHFLNIPWKFWQVKSISDVINVTLLKVLYYFILLKVTGS